MIENNWNLLTRVIVVEILSMKESTKLGNQVPLKTSN